MCAAKFASAFLSHSSKDKDFVRAVANSLVQRGVLAWLDETQLNLGPLQEKLKEAISNQSLFVIFLSEHSAGSVWCKREIEWMKDNKEARNLIIPIYLGKKTELEKLVNEHPQLKEIFFYQDQHGTSLNQLGGITYGSNNLTGNSLSSESDKIASFIARVVYKKLIQQNWDEVIIHLEERGCSALEGFPTLPKELQNKNAPILTFRPCIDEVSYQYTLTDKIWQRVASNMKEALSVALGKLKGQNRTVHISGHAQIGCFWLLGTHFNRTTDVDLYCYGQNDIMMSNAAQERIGILSGDVSQHTIELIDGSISSDQFSIALLVGPKNQYVANVKEHNKSRNIPLFHISTEMIRDSEDAITLVKDIVIQVQALKETHNFKEVFIYWTTAAQVAVLAAANLTHHVISKVSFIEYTPNTNDNGGYCHLPMPKEKN